MPSRRRSDCFQFAATGTCSRGDNCRFRHRQGQTPNPEEPNALRDFFAEYPTFQYNPGFAPTKEFRRLASKLKLKGENRKVAYSRFQRALVIRFNEAYGTDADDVAPWHAVCRAMHIVPLPSDVRECKEIFYHISVNLVDLVHAADTGIRVRTFRSVQALREYTILTGQYFPKDDEAAGGVLRFLRRDILKNAPHNRGPM